MDCFTKFLTKSTSKNVYTQEDPVTQTVGWERLRKGGRGAERRRPVDGEEVVHEGRPNTLCDLPLTDRVWVQR